MPSPLKCRPVYCCFASVPRRQLQEAGAVLNGVSWPGDEVDRALFGDRQVTGLTVMRRQQPRIAG